MKRYGMTDSSLFKAYENTLKNALVRIPEEQQFPVKTNGVEKDFGIIQIVFNDIVVFSELLYASRNKPQQCSTAD